MKVRVIKSFNGPGIYGHIGDELELDSKQAKDLLNAGYVEAVEEEKKTTSSRKAKSRRKTTKKGD